MKNEQNLSRRNFLKKSAYVVPTIVTLGALETPVEANGKGMLGHSCCKAIKPGEMSKNVGQMSKNVGQMFRANRQ